MAVPCKVIPFPRVEHQFPHPSSRKQSAIPSQLGKKITDTSKPNRKKTILIIEDQYGFREIFSDILTHGGYHVTQAEDGLQGWELVKTTKPDLVLLDLMLPKMHGFEILKKIRSEPLTRKTPVIIISVLEEPADKTKGFELGANDYIVKSHLSHQQIVDKVATLLKNQPEKD